MLFIQWVRLFPTKQECVAQSTLETPPQETLCKTRLDFVFYTWNEGRRIRRNSLNHLLGFPPLVQQKKKFHRTQPSTAIILSSSKGWLIPPPPPVRYDKTWYFEAARTFVWQGIGRSILDLLSTRCGGSMVLLSLTRFAPLKCQCPRYSFGNSVPMYLWHKTKCQCIFGTRPIPFTRKRPLWANALLLRGIPFCHQAPLLRKRWHITRHRLAHDWGGLHSIMLILDEPDHRIDEIFWEHHIQGNYLLQGKATGVVTNFFQIQRWWGREYGQPLFENERKGDSSAFMSVGCVGWLPSVYLH